MTGEAGDARPLAGRRVLVTRPRAQAAELIALLESAGAGVVVAPTVRIDPPADPLPLQQAAADLTRFDWIVFSSANAVDALLDAVDAEQVDGPFDTAANGGRRSASGRLRGGRAEHPVKFAAVGSRTAERLRSRGVDVALVPDEFIADALVRVLTSRATVRGTRVLLPRSEIGREVIADGLRAAGAIVTEVIAYRTVAEAEGNDTAAVRRLLIDGRLDAVTFTSGSAVRHFVQMYGADSVALLRDTVVAVIGPVTADAARQLGVPVHVQPAAYTSAAMVDALKEYLARRA